MKSVQAEMKELKGISAAKDATKEVLLERLTVKTQMNYFKEKVNLVQDEVKSIQENVVSVQAEVTSVDDKSCRWKKSFKEMFKNMKKEFKQ